MTTLLPTLERDLLHAARRTDPAAEGVGRSAPRPRAGFRRIVPVTAVLATMTVAGGAYAARGMWMPELGTASYGSAVATADPVPDGERATLGVLRRGQTARDRGPAALAVLRGAGPRIGEVRTDAVRRLGALPDGRVAVLVPARLPQGFDPTLPNMGRNQLLLALYDPEAREMDGFLSSDALGMRAGNLMLPTRPRLTPSERSRARAFLDHEVEAGRLRERPEPPYYDVLSIEQSVRYRAAVGLPSAGPATYVGVVPDGVASVQIDGGDVVAVHDNFFVAPTTVNARQHVRWLDAQGAVVPFASTLGAWK